MLTVDGQIHNFAESGSDSIDRFAQVISLVVLLDSPENERSVRMYAELLGVLVTGNVKIISGSCARTASPRDRRWWKSIGVAVQHQLRHTLRCVDVLRLHHPTGRNYIPPGKHSQSYNSQNLEPRRFSRRRLQKMQRLKKKEKN